MVNQDIQKPEVIWVYEVWESKEDHDSSLQDERVKQLIAEAGALLGSKPEPGMELVTLGGKLG
jgi:quinol monooxygenase YgiN